MMAFGIVDGSEAYLLHHQDYQRVSDDGHNGGRGGGGEAQGAYLLRAAGMDDHPGHAGQGTGRVAGDDDQGKAGVQFFCQIHQFEDLTRLARVGDEQQQIVWLYHPQVAMLRFAGMEEDGRCAGGGEGGSDVDADLARFAHAAGDHLAAILMHTTVDQLYRLGEMPVQRNIADGCCLTRQNIFDEVLHDVTIFMIAKLRNFRGKKVKGLKS